MYRVATFVLTILDSDILAIFYPISEIGSGLCVGLSLQAREGHIYFTELAERVEYGNYDLPGLRLAFGREVVAHLKHMCYLI